MNTNEAKFILRARRADGRDDAAPCFAEALAQARLDPALGAWLAKEQAFDAAVTARLREVAPPEGLRDAILAGARMASPRPWWREARTLGIAAAVALMLGLTATVSLDRGAPGTEQLAFAAMDDKNSPGHHASMPGGQAGLHAMLADPTTRLGAGLPLDFETIKAGGCRVLSVAGREVLEVCFHREGTGKLHLYVARREDFGGEKSDARPIFRERDSLASVSWADARHTYILVSDTGAHALRAAL